MGEQYLLWVRWKNGAEDSLPLTKGSYDFLKDGDVKLALAAVDNKYMLNTPDGGKLFVKLDNAVCMRLVVVGADEEFS